MGLCFMFLALVWVMYLMPKANRQRQEEFLRRVRENSRDDEPTDEGEGETKEEG